MSAEPDALLTSKSAFCISDWQIEEAQSLVERDDEAGRKVRAEVHRAEAELTRNERAALAFLLITRLLDEDQ